MVNIADKERIKKEKQIVHMGNNKVNNIVHIKVPNKPTYIIIITITTIRQAR